MTITHHPRTSSPPPAPVDVVDAVPVGDPAPAGDASPGGSRLGGWCLVALAVVSRAYVAFVATLAVTAFAASLLQWDSFVVRSGSMEPAISVGDVVLASPLGATESPEPGRVFVFENPAATDGDHLLVHRVVDRRQQQWVTKGDANGIADVAPVPRDAFRARARILVPLIGLPVVWREEGRTPLVVGWLVVTTAALLGALLIRPERGHGRSRRGPRSRRPWWVRWPRPSWPGWHGWHGHARPSTRAVLSVAAAAATIAVTTGAATSVASAGFTDSTRNSGNSWSVGDVTLQPYTRAVLIDGPLFFYLLDEAGGASALDSSGNDRTGILAAIAGYAQPGALPNNPGSAVNLGGGTGRVVSGGGARTDPRTFSIELWFRTSSSAGGKLFGFESSQAALPAVADRYVTMRTDGRLVYGDWTGSHYRTITTPASYRDGAWHHLVLTSAPNGIQEHATLYLDGAEVASGLVTRTAGFSGWWRAGYGRISLGALGFPGSIDQFAGYGTTLTAQRVQAHYAAR